MLDYLHQHSFYYLNTRASALPIRADEIVRNVVRNYYLYSPCNIADGINLSLAVLCDNYIRDCILVFNKKRVELDLFFTLTFNGRIAFLSNNTGTSDNSLCLTV
jgi:hypothetical protein